MRSNQGIDVTHEIRIIYSVVIITSTVNLTAIVTLLLALLPIRPGGCPECTWFDMRNPHKGLWANVRIPLYGGMLFNRCTEPYGDMRFNLSSVPHK